MEKNPLKWQIWYLPEACYVVNIAFIVLYLYVVTKCCEWLNACRLRYPGLYLLYSTGSRLYIYYVLLAFDYDRCPLGSEKSKQNFPKDRNTRFGTRESTSGTSPHRP